MEETYEKIPVAKGEPQAYKIIKRRVIQEEQIVTIEQLEARKAALQAEIERIDAQIKKLKEL